MRHADIVHVNEQKPGVRGISEAFGKRGGGIVVRLLGAGNRGGERCQDEDEGYQQKEPGYVHGASETVGPLKD